MLQYHITVISKSKISIRKFFIFFNQILKNFNIIKKHLKKENKKKFLTILKSPHINKSAQEQFETRLFLSQITTYHSIKNLQILIFLKKIKIYLFPHIRIKIKFTINKSLIKKTQYKTLNPNNFKLNFFNKQFKNDNLRNKTRYKSKQSSKKTNTLLTQTKYLLSVFNTYGKI